MAVLGFKTRGEQRGEEEDATRAQTVAFNHPRTMVSSAARIRLTNRSEVEATRQRNANAAGWQTAAWECYDNVGEVNYAFNYSASVLSRVRFHAAVVIQPDSAPVEVSDATKLETDESGSTVGTVNGVDPRLAAIAAKYMRQLGAKGGMAPLVKAFGLNIQVAGECYLCCLDGRWGVRSTSELKIDAGGYAVLQPSQAIGTLMPRRLKKGTPIGRIWNQHPRYSADSDSSLRAVLFDCEELILLARLMRVTARSRLNAGILFIPDELSAAARSVGVNDDTDSEDDEDLDPLEKELFDSMTAPVAQEDNAAAIVPMLIRGPSAEGPNIKYIQLARDVGTELASRSKDVLNRVLQGINAPKELATGMSGSRYNNAQLIDEQSYKALVEPMALTFSDAVTAIYLQPMLRADSEVHQMQESIPDIAAQIERIVCWYDPSEVVTSVDQSAAANDGWDRHILSDKAWLKAHGFSDNDQAGEKELATRLALSQVAVQPNLQLTLFQAAFPTIFKAAQAAAQAANGTGGFPPALSEMLGGGTGNGNGTNGSGSSGTNGNSSEVSPSPPVPATSVPTGV